MIIFWTITRELMNSIKFLEKYNLKIIVMVKCVKISQNNVVLRTHGHLLQHSMEYCLIAINPKSFDLNNWKSVKIPNVIFFHNDGITNAKPRYFYEIVSKLMPDQIHLELFGRSNNMFANWVTVGNEM